MIKLIPKLAKPAIRAAKTVATLGGIALAKKPIEAAGDAIKEVFTQNTATPAPYS